nr:biotin-dependent carboxyltransferase family protein [Deinobacterium chartae]
MRAGPTSAVQDLGRPGYARSGISRAGAADRWALRIANLLVGNPEGAAALELTTGTALRFEADHLVALSGADLSADLEGLPLPLHRPVRVRAGEILRLGAPRSGVRAYLAVAGGLDLPLDLGSRATDLRAGLGGLGGRALRAGDVLAVGQSSDWAQGWTKWLARRARRATSWALDPDLLPRYSRAPVLRAVPGPEEAEFARHSREAFWRDAYEVTRLADRVGVRLEGASLIRREARELLSGAVVPGVVQVPPGGQPLVLSVEAQTLGGYPRIAVVASVDLPLLVQLAPGHLVRFERTTPEEARAARARLAARLSSLRATLSEWRAERA